MTRKGRPSKPKSITISYPMIEVDNPYYSPLHAAGGGNSRKIMAAYNPRESYVGFLFGKGLISEAEKRAGDRVRQAFEAMGGAGARAMDYSAPKVSGGAGAESVTVNQLRAGEILRECHRALGPQGHDLVLKLCGECLWPKDLSGNLRKQNYLSMRLRECLEVLAVLWGFSTRGTMQRAG